MQPGTLRKAGLLIVLLITVIYGGVTILSLLAFNGQYAQNKLRQDLWRAGHAHAGVLLILSLVSYIYAEQARLSPFWKRLSTSLIPISAILMPAGFFLSVLKPSATKVNDLIYLTYAGAVTLATGLLILGIGLLRVPKNNFK